MALPEYRGARPTPFQIEGDLAAFNQQQRAEKNRRDVTGMNDLIAEIIAARQTDTEAPLN
jgi:hypothetical protein